MAKNRITKLTALDSNTTEKKELFGDPIVGN